MFRRSPPPPPPPQQQQQQNRSQSPPPPPPPPPPAPLSAGLSATTLGKQSQPGLGSGSALAALASLKMGLSGLVGGSHREGSTPASSHGASAAGATHVRKHSRRQASRDLKELKLSSKAAKAAEKAHSKRIDAMLAEQEAAEKAVVKILLLGPGESGTYAIACRRCFLSCVPRLELHGATLVASVVAHPSLSVLLLLMR